jgi:oxaloacetate decarboxylase alpha subunit
VLAEIPRVREDLGFVPLVTPTSQIVGTQAVLNVLMKQRYKIISKEAAALLRGEYGATPAPVNPELQKRVLNGKTAITTRPADHLEPEMKPIEENLRLKLPGASIEDVLTYALFPDVGLKFLENRSVH